MEEPLFFGPSDSSSMINREDGIKPVFHSGEEEKLSSVICAVECDGIPFAWFIRPIFVLLLPFVLDISGKKLKPGPNTDEALCEGNPDVVEEK